MSNQGKKSIDKNYIYIGIFTIVAIILIVAVISINSNKNKPTPAPAANNSVQQSTALSVISENGNQRQTLKSDINFRKIKFSKSIKDIKAYEQKQTDTLDNPDENTSEDGYTYLSYKYNPENPATYFGAQVLPSDINSMLTYVFHNGKLIEIRIQYGSIGSDEFDKIVTSNNSIYGNSTYSRSYSNGTKDLWWKTSKHTLNVICQGGNVIAYYKVNNK